MRRLSGIVLVLLLVHATSEQSNAETKVEFSGYFKDYTTDIILNAPLIWEIDRSHLSSSNRLRFNLKVKSPGIWSVHAAYDLTLLVQSSALFAQNPLGFYSTESLYRVTDLKFQLYPTSFSFPFGTTAIYQNLDRLRLRVRTAPFDVIIGRQAIAWGAARVVNPTDVIAPFRYAQLDTEDRAGVDAIRVVVPLGALSELDAGYLPGHEFDSEKSVGFARLLFNTMRTDVSIMALRAHDFMLLGLDIAGSVGGAGIWIEAAETEILQGSSEGRQFTRLSAGMDYSITPAWYAFLEYHYSGTGSNKASEYYGGRSSRPLHGRIVYLLGKHYLAPGAVYQLTPLWVLSAGALVNLGDPSVLLSPRIEYNVIENAYLEVGAHLGFGQANYLNDAYVYPVLGIGSEFGAYPDQLYFSFRYYY